MTHKATEEMLARMADQALSGGDSRPGEIVTEGRKDMRRAAILEAARQAVTVDRAATHGDVEATFGKIAALWSALLGVSVTPAQVCLMLVALKTARAWGNPTHEDNWVDLAGYAACGGELSGVAGDT